MKRWSRLATLVVLLISWLAVPASSSAYDPPIRIIGFHHRDVDGSLIPGWDGGSLGYGFFGTDFVGASWHENIMPGTDYTLVIVPEGDLISPWTWNWASPWPVKLFVLASGRSTGTTWGDATLSLHFSKDVGRSLNGARAWLVPSDCLEGNHLVRWNSLASLFDADESDWIYYTHVAPVERPRVYFPLIRRS